MMGETTSIDPNAQKIQFQLSLPAKWNIRALMFGGENIAESLPRVLASFQPVLATSQCHSSSVMPLSAVISDTRPSPPNAAATRQLRSE